MSHPLPGVCPTRRSAPLPRRSRIACFWLLLLALLLAAPPVAAGKKWNARFAPRKGTVQKLAFQTDVNLRAKVPLIGGPEGRLALRVESTRRVAKRKRRGPTAIELTLDRIAFDFEFSGDETHYDSADPDSGSDDDGLLGSYVGILLGRTLALDVLRTGEVVAVHGVEDMMADLERLSGEESAIAPVLSLLTHDLSATALKTLLQQATPVYPGKRLRVGDAWSREAELPNPLFESMNMASEYELQEIGGHEGRKAARITVRQDFRPEGQGPLLDQLRLLAGIEGEVRLQDGAATGTSVIWSERKTGLTLSFEMEQRIRAKLSIPLRVLGFTRRTSVPLEMDQKTVLYRVD